MDWIFTILFVVGFATLFSGSPGLVLLWACLLIVATLWAIVSKIGEANRLGKGIKALAVHYAEDSVKHIVAGVTANNLETSKSRMEKVFETIRQHAGPVDKADQKAFLAKIHEAFEAAVRKEEAREEQRRIKEKIREEVRAERERDAMLRQVQREEAAIRTALDKALRETNDEHAAVVLRLKAELAEAQAKTERAKSQAQLTKAGFVYVISNIGAFGEGVFKVGMTRRLEPMDRVRELGDASVPFPFDVHLMASCDDAPALEAALHRGLHQKRLNKVNLRKEFFRTTIDEVIALVEKSHGKVDYRADPEALEYHETKQIEERGFNAPYDPELHEDADEETAEVAA